MTPRLVRGLDYYTNTVFEIVAEGLGAQNAICGGGAYEGLVEELGGPPTYGVGFAIGEDRLLDVLPASLSSAPRSGATRRRRRWSWPGSRGLRTRRTSVSPSFAFAERLRRPAFPAVEATTNKTDKIFERAQASGSPAVVLMSESGDVRAVKLLASGERRELSEAELVQELQILMR